MDSPAIALHPATVPSAPREPSARARELIFRYQGRQLVLLLVGSIFIAVGIVPLLVFDWNLPVDLALSARGHESVGQVLDAQLVSNTRINHRHPTRIRFRYQVAGQEHTAVSTTIDPAIVATAQPGAEVPIEVLDGHPEWARVQGTTASLLGSWGLFMLLFPTIGAFLVFFAVRSNRREIRAFIHGQPIVARVVFAGSDTSVRMNGRNPYVVRWEFQVEGNVYDGAISSMKLLLIEPLMKQQELLVLYDPENPRINTVYVA